MYFQRLFQQHLLPHLHFCNGTLPTSIKESLFLHLLESGKALCLLWLIEFKESEAVPIPIIALNFLETSTYCLLEISQYIRSTTTLKPPSEKPKPCGEAWRMKCYLDRWGGREGWKEKGRGRGRERKRGKERGAKEKWVPDIEWRSDLGCESSSHSCSSWRHND